MPRHQKQDVIIQPHQSLIIGLPKSGDKIKQIPTDVTPNSAFSTYNYGYNSSQQYHKELKVSY